MEIAVLVSAYVITGLLVITFVSYREPAQRFKIGVGVDE
jgi:hypothetical protein